MNSENHTAPENLKRCGSCQHSVDVRGMVQIVCMAHLSIRHPTKDGGCEEFEVKRQRTQLQLAAESYSPGGIV